MALTVTQEPQISQLDALWTLFQAQTKSVRKAFTKRILEQAAMAKKSCTKSTDDDVAAMKRDTEKVFYAIERGLKEADKLPAMDIDAAEKLLKSL